MTAKEKLEILREKMAENQVDGYIIPSSDPHMTEYLADCYQSRSWFSGFNGSAGTLAVSRKEAGLWTDGRYFIQAERQLAGSDIQLMRMAQKETPEIPQWLAQQLPEGGVMGLDGMVTSTALVKSLEKALSKKGITLKDIDFVAPIWGQERPAVPATKAWIQDVKYAGKTPAEKLTLLREALAEQEADSVLVTRLDSVAWLLNLRADDIAYNPFALAYCLVTPESATLFITTCRMPKEAASYLREQGVAVREYSQVVDAVKEISSPSVFLYEPAGLNYTLYNAMEQNPAITLLDGDDPVQLLKGVKNPVEIENIKTAHARDGAAMVRFAMELEEKMAAGEPLTECDIPDMLRRLRGEQPENLGESFDTIAAYGENAAMMHYHPVPEACASLQPKGFLLVDSGGQYYGGTTDITRTYALGTPTLEEKEAYTLVLKSHIDLAMAVFLEGVTGGNLDILARSPMWKRGLDYRCGTGHGVGFLGGVHEGPQSLRVTNNVPFRAGMTITDEPGIYEEGQIGVRTENELLCKEWGVTEYGRYLCFEPITYCPIDQKAILPEMLSPEELAWLNDYHALVLKTLTPLLNFHEQEWLKKACAPIQG